MQARIAKHSNRKLVVIVAVLGLVASLGSLAQAQPSPPDQDGVENDGKHVTVPGTKVTDPRGPVDPLVGTWLFTVIPDDGSPTFIVYETYSASGAVAAIDNQAPPSQETVAIGTWRKAGPHKYFESQWQFLYDANGNFVGTWIGQIEDLIDESGTHILPSPFTWKIIDASGNVIASGSGKSVGVKMPEPGGPEQ